MVETLISELAGVPVRERCERGVKPSCCFEVAPFENIAARERNRTIAGGSTG
jgi:hypothetical protein